MFFEQLGAALMKIVLSIRVEINFYFEVPMIDILGLLSRCLWVGTMLAGGRFQTQERLQVF